MTKKQLLFLGYLITTILTLMAPKTFAQEQQIYTDYFQIKSEIAEFLEDKYAEVYDGRLEIIIPTITKYGKLRSCENIEYFLPNYSNSASRITVGVQCIKPANWTLYLPVTIQVFKPVVTINSNLNKNHVIELDDLTMQDANIFNISSSYFEDPSEAIGLNLKRPVQANKILLKSMVEKPKIIKRGDIVDIIVRTQGLMIKSKGQAMEDGAHNEFIKVKNLTSKRIIEAQTVKIGEVKVNI